MNNKKPDLFDMSPLTADLIVLLNSKLDSMINKADILAKNSDLEQKNKDLTDELGVSYNVSRVGKEELLNTCKFIVKQEKKKFNTLAIFTVISYIVFIIGYIVLSKFL